MKTSLSLFPVIPGVNDSDQQIKDIAVICKDINIKRLRLLPYHHFGESKYSNLNREYLMEKNISVTQVKLTNYQKLVEEYGISCNIE